MEIHEAANLFPLDEDTIAELAEDIRRRGLVESVKVFRGKVLDGRRRMRACEIAGVQPRFEEVATDDPIAYSWSLNGPRRHLTKSQLAMVGARMREMYDKEAKERMSQGGGDKKSGKAKSGKENLPYPIPSTSGQARDKAGDVVGVSGRTIDFATAVLKQAVPELVKAVEEGRVAVSTAAAIAVEDEDVQRARIEERSDKKATGTNRKAKGGKQEESAPKQEQPPTAGLRGVGVHWANEAINSLIRIPRDDPQRAMAKKIIKDWIMANL